MTGEKQMHRIKTRVTTAILCFLLSVSAYAGSATYNFTANGLGGVVANLIIYSSPSSEGTDIAFVEVSAEICASSPCSPATALPGTSGAEFCSRNSPQVNLYCFKLTEYTMPTYKCPYCGRGEYKDWDDLFVVVSNVVHQHPCQLHAQTGGGGGPT